jgi:hypothetical protein
VARVLVAPQPTLGSYPTLQPSAGALALAFQAADPSLLNYCPLTSAKTYLLAMNTDSAPHTVTISSAVDSFNRPGDITAYSLPAITGTTPVIAQFGPFALAGWGNGGNLNFQASDATVKFAVVTLP